MAWAEKLPSGKYRGMYRDADGAKRSAGTFGRKDEAVRQAGAKEVNERGSPTPREARTVTWGEWEPRWEGMRLVVASTERSDKGRLRDHVRPRWKNEPLRSITGDDVQRWVAALADSGMAPSTVAKCYYLLSSSMKAALQAKLIPTNPCSGIKLPKAGPMPERFLDADEVSAIEASLDGFDAFVVKLLLGSGIRLGEAMGLHWQSVDLKRKELTVEWAYDPVAQLMKTPKDHERRTIPVGETLAGLLNARLNKGGVGRPAAPPVEYPRNARVHSGLVLAHTQGRPFDPSNLRHRFEASVRIAYVGVGKKRHQIGHVRLHDLRHTYASRLLEAGVPIEEVSRLLGHASITTTMRYAHRARSQWDNVRSALG
ncbi:tyrosine-type recombinase/integrase [Antrihabitans sp. YC2-6]|uniref:tyrosine-type recombinase/integrase n=1 Tax=Antrihabitans sp. YC2-6 TaxID=2799498 RepID=UPI0018F70C99|nr:tyrosine-type recombinase/integrase [Antrihabitans sp. YC2-6]MBJ8344421.1 tyrosine-type recombinase/integrase [Antrihabitans sp. YC2-6]